MTKRLLLASVAILAIGWLIAPLANATITDDIDPIGSAVNVALSNAGGPASSGYVTIAVTYVSGGTETRDVPFSIAADGETQVTALFSSPVRGAIVVGITEGPDPIP